MHKLILLIFTFLSFSVSAGIELLVGGAGTNMSFETSFDSTQKYSGTLQGVQGTARGNLSAGRLQVGAMISKSHGVAKFSESGETSENNFEHLY